MTVNGRLAGVQLAGSCSGVTEPAPKVRLRELLNMNINQMYVFGMVGSCSHNIQCQKMLNYAKKKVYETVLLTLSKGRAGPVFL